MSDEMTALMLATKARHVAVVNALLASGTDVQVDQAKSDGWTALFLAAVHGHEPVAALLLDHGAAVDGIDESGGTPLCVAAAEGHTTVVALLLNHNAGINKRYSSDGWSPLMFASSCVHESVVRLLLSRNDVDTSLRDQRGRDCRDVTCNKLIRSLIDQHRVDRERDQLFHIGVAFASKTLPVHILVAVYEQCIAFDDQRVPLFACWEVLKLLKEK
eukprot:TRINITY_DN9786_c0_g1_i1.p1 TRINITY_DN9786_c0_g1~~TRINITY_DN9786_c0_g1_i1.p1  ORF type:complete len:216 (+),score=31.71 TRINITY_DN9786_c0_g1_i1:152-799(+)